MQQTSELPTKKKLHSDWQEICGILLSFPNPVHITALCGQKETAQIAASTLGQKEKNSNFFVTFWPVWMRGGLKDLFCSCLTKNTDESGGI